ncbi:MAG: adenine-specific methyltransferase EcoRI family protein [Gammaproteobacteria bacterium]|nr:adenine-specific methyltransferase EcoRI family protein [Gammaproteobacteria bacterium]
MSNTNLHKAKRERNDEFYTQMEDVVAELQHYKAHFKGNVVYCNCDNPSQSNFYKYFAANYTALGLKDLLFNAYQDENHGDFRSEQAIAKLKRADIVVTNPPFSLFREFMAQLVEYDKEFIILGPTNALGYLSVFNLFKTDKVWAGVNNKPLTFDTPSGTSKAVPICWFTNLDHNNYREPLVLTETYDPDKYPTYENYDAINVDRLDKIPMDYTGVMGVPITYLLRHKTKQLNLLGLGVSEAGRSVGVGPYKPEHAEYRKTVQKSGVVEGDLYYMKDGVPTKPYYRVLVDNPQFNLIGIGKSAMGTSVGVQPTLPAHQKQHLDMKKGGISNGTVYYMKDGQPVLPYYRVLIQTKEQSSD